MRPVRDLAHPDALEAVLGFIQLLVDPADSVAVDAETELLESTILTSMNIAELLVFVRDELGTDIPAEALVGENFCRASAIADLIVSLRAKPAPCEAGFTS